MTFNNIKLYNSVCFWYISYIFWPLWCIIRNKYVFLSKLYIIWRRFGLSVCLLADNQRHKNKKKRVEKPLQIKENEKI